MQRTPEQGESFLLEIAMIEKQMAIDFARVSHL
jgi:hypothetical protein